MIENRVRSEVSTAAIGCLYAMIYLIMINAGVSILLVGIAIACIIVIGIIRTEWLLVIVLLSAIYYTPLNRFSCRIGGILVIPMDAIFLVMTIAMLLRKILVERPAPWCNGSCPLERGVRLTGVVTGSFLLIFFIACMLGFFRYHYWQTILTEAKVGLFFGAIPLVADVFGTRRIGLDSLLLFIVLASSVGCIYDLYARIWHVYTVSAFTGDAAGAVSYAYTAAGEIVRDYGWGSTFVYQVFSVLISFVFVLKTQRTLPRLGWLGLLVINLLSNLLTVTRGFMVGLLIGLAAVIILSALERPVSRAGVWGKGMLRAATAVLLLVGLLFAMVQVIPPTSAAFERFYGLYDRNYAGRGDETNMEFRLQSMQLGLRTALEHPFGVGFGYMEPSSSLSAGQKRIRHLVYHNSFGFMLYKFGFPGTVTIIGIFAMLLSGLFRLFRSEKEVDHRVLICLMGSLLALLSMSLTSTNWLFDHSSLLPFTVVIIAGSLSNIECVARTR